MLTADERAQALADMDQLVHAFYARAVRVHVHPFVEFAGVMRAYVNSCERAHADGIDFSECNAHTGHALPMESFEVRYLNEKLNCIFGGRITAEPATEAATRTAS